MMTLGECHVEPDEALVNQLVSQINRIAKNATLDFALNVGKVVVDGFYGGSATAWRNRRPKDTSFRKLSRHPDLLLSPSALYRSVAIYELVGRLGIDPRGRLSSGHLRAVLPLPHEDQSRLLALADTEGWSVSRLEHEIGEHCQPVVGRGGRKKQSVLRKSLDSLDSWLTGAREVAQSEECAGELSPDSARLAAAMLVQVEQVCAALRGRISSTAPEDDTEPSDK